MPFEKKHQFVTRKMAGFWNYKNIEKSNQVFDVASSSVRESALLNADTNITSSLPLTHV